MSKYSALRTAAAMPSFTSMLSNTNRSDQGRSEKSSRTGYNNYFIRNLHVSLEDLVALQGISLQGSLAPTAGLSAVTQPTHSL